MRSASYGTLFLSLVFLSSFSHAGDTSSGATLNRPSNARAAALGDALTARDADISAFDFNPASLSSLKQPQVSLFFERGQEQGGFGKIVFGAPTTQAGFGASLGYFSSGSIDIYDDNGATSVEGQRDFSMAIGGSRRLGNSHVGVTGKYLQSTLAESESARAAALDFGFQQQLSRALRAGVSVLNIGSDLKFGSEGDPLARQVRAGALSRMRLGAVAFGLQLDSSYFLVERDVQWGAGLETAVGPLSLRAGFKSRSGQNQIGAGTGFALGNIDLDYSISFDAQTDMHHQASVLMKFGSSSSAVPTPQPLHSSVVPAAVLTTSRIANPGEFASHRAMVYEVKAGDSWESIAERFLGSEKLARVMKDANRFAGITELKTGMKILVP